MPIEKITKYRCSRCNKTHTYQELIKEKTININNKEFRYAHYCPICRNDKFIVMSTVIKS